MSVRRELGDWRSKFSVIQRWGEARKRNMFTDVNFIVGEGKSARWFSAHKSVLAFCSPVFEAMFYGTMAEKKNNIAIVDIDPGVFDALLRFAYGEKISFPCVSFAGKTHLAADKYLIPDLQVLADEHVSKATMDESQFWEVVQQDIFFLVPVVKKKCLGYISQRATLLFKSHLFTGISCDVLLEILQMDNIRVTEFELLSAVVRWGIGNIQSGKNLKSTVGSLLEHIRFTNLTVEEFRKFSDSHLDLLDADDALAIRMHLRNRLNYKLPEWCSKSSIKRHQAVHAVQTFHNFYCRCAKCGWRAQCSGVVQRWGEARKKKFLTDVNFLIGEGDRAMYFSAHKNVLSFNSPIFETMFYTDLSEKNDPIAVVDIAPEAFDKLLRYSYGEEIKIMSIPCAAKIYIAAEKYLIPDLKAKAKHSVSTLKIDDQQFWEIIVEEKFFQIPVIKDKCLGYISENAPSLFSSYLFSNLTPSVLEEILLLDEMNLSEFELLSAVVRWGISNTGSEMKLKAKLSSFLPYIRFSSLTTEEFCNFLNNHPGLIDSYDSLAILKHLLERSVYKLPLWCSIVVDKRNKKGG